MSRTFFWLTAGASALTLAALAALLLPYEFLQMDSLAERRRGWLLTVWTAGVMAICFGAAGLLTAVAPLSFRDVAEAGSVGEAVQLRRELRERADSVYYNFAGWTVSAGGFLILIYFTGWLLLGRL